MIPVLTGDANLSVAVGITVETKGATLCPAYAVVDVITRIARPSGASVVSKAVVSASASFESPSIASSEERGNEESGR